MDDDFLWASALIHRSEGDNRMDVIPDHEDDMSQFGKIGSHRYNIKGRDGSCHDGATDATDAATAMVPLSYMRYRRCVQNSSTSGGIEIEIIESRGCGVLDIIGGELWQGSLVLCAYLLMRVPRCRLLQADVLELGSGVGLPAMLLIALKSLFSTGEDDEKVDVRSVHMNDMYLGRVVLSDNDSRVIDNLRSAVSKQFEEQHSYTSDSDVGDTSGDDRGDDDVDDVVVSSIRSSYVPVAIHRLDWRHCMEVEYTHPQSKSIFDSNRLYFNGDDEDGAHAKHRMIIGSELCYSKSHATYLARLIKSHLLCPRKQLRYDEVIICQVRDREGFTELLALLGDDDDDGDDADGDDDDELSGKISYIVEEVPEALFAVGQRIEKKTNVYSSCINEDEGNNRSIYRFPLAILQGISCAYDESSVMRNQGIDPEVTSFTSSLQKGSLHHQLEMDESHHYPDFKSYLISTDITAFVILRIKAIHLSSPTI